MIVVRPRWQWRLLDAAGTDIDRPGSPVFLTRFDAEQWLGEHWRALADQGAHRAVLLNEGAEVQPAVDLPADGTPAG